MQPLFEIQMTKVKSIWQFKTFETKCNTFWGLLFYNSIKVYSEIKTPKCLSLSLSFLFYRKKRKTPKWKNNRGGGKLVGPKPAQPPYCGPFFLVRTRGRPGCAARGGGASTSSTPTHLPPFPPAPFAPSTRRPQTLAPFPLSSHPRRRSLSLLPLCLSFPKSSEFLLNRSMHSMAGSWRGWRGRRARR